jgi:hypothetical protein
MIHILECSPNPSDATSYYRTRGIIPFLVKQHSAELTCSAMNGYLKATWADIIPYDVILIQRPTTQKELEFIQMCRRMNKVVWADFDDLHTDIPKSNPVFHVNPDGGKYMLECAKNSSFVTVSTKAIKEKLLEVTEHVYVVKNAHNDYVYPIKFMQSGGDVQKPLVVWRGGVTHEEDLYSFKEQMQSVAEKYRFKMFGNVPHYVKRDFGVSDNDVIPGMPLDQYLNFMVQINPAFMVFPLQQNKFNRAKSNISALEALYSGGICIVPEGFEEFADTAVLSNDFVGTIFSLTNKETFEKVLKVKVENMLATQILSVTNEQRYEILTHYTKHLN